MVAVALPFAVLMTTTSRVCSFASFMSFFKGRFRSPLLFVGLASFFDPSDPYSSSSDGGADFLETVEVFGTFVAFDAFGFFSDTPFLGGLAIAPKSSISKDC